jgi:hypothetical protein
VEKNRVEIKGTSWRIFLSCGETIMAIIQKDEIKY